MTESERDGAKRLREAAVLLGQAYSKLQDARDSYCESLDRKGHKQLETAMGHAVAAESITGGLLRRAIAT